MIVRAFLNISIGRLRRPWVRSRGSSTPGGQSLEHLGQVASAGSRAALMATTVAAGPHSPRVHSQPAMRRRTRFRAAQVLARAQAVPPAVVKTAPAITFTSISSSPRVGESYRPRATGGGSGSPVVFSIASRSASVCSLADSIVSFLSAGTCAIDANESGNATSSPRPRYVRACSFALRLQRSRSRATMRRRVARSCSPPRCRDRLAVRHRRGR